MPPAGLRKILFLIDRADQFWVKLYCETPIYIFRKELTCWWGMSSWGRSGHSMHFHVAHDHHQRILRFWGSWSHGVQDAEHSSRVNWVRPPGFWSQHWRGSPRCATRWGGTLWAITWVSSICSQDMSRRRDRRAAGALVHVPIAVAGRSSIPGACEM